MYKESESSRFVCMANWASPWPPWSSTVSCRAPFLHVWPPGLLLCLRDHVPIVGELPVCSYGELGISLATLIIYELSEIILLARMASWASPRPPWSCTNCQRAPGLLVWRTGHLLGHPDHLRVVGDHPACTYGHLGFSSASVLMYQLSESSRFARMVNWASPWPPWSSTSCRRSSCLHVWPPGHLLGHPDHLRVVGDHPALHVWPTWASPWPPWSSTELSEIILLARMATWASPRPPWSCTNCGRGPGLHVWRPGLLLGLHDHLQLVGEHPACMYGDLGFSLASIIISNQSESTLLARMVTSTSPCSPWSCTNCWRASVCTYGDLDFFLASLII